MEPWLRLDRAGDAEARALLRSCCGSTRWVERMLARRPVGDRDTLLRAAREEWFALAADDWLEAFSHHPRIGDRETLRRGFVETRHLSETEQAGVNTASSETLAELAAANDAYHRRFGYIFIVCASGKSASDMLALLRARLPNGPARELQIAAEQQAQITERRLLQLS